MPWSWDTGGGAFVHAGTTRDVVTAGKLATNPFEPDPMVSGTGAYQITIGTASHNVFLWARGSEDGRWSVFCILCLGSVLNGFDGGARTGTHMYAAIVRAVTLPYTSGAKKRGSVQYTVLQEDNLDATASPPVAVASTDTNVALEYRIVEDTVELHVKDTLVVEHEFTASDHPHYRFYGFGSATDGAIVKNPRVYALDPIVSPAGRIECFVSDGRLFISENDEKPRDVGIICRGGYTQPWGGDYDNELYVGDGLWLRVWNPTTGIRKYAPEDGSGGYKAYWDIAEDGYPPGAPDVPGDPTRKQIGVCTATIGCFHLNRLQLGGIPETAGSDIWGSCIGQVARWRLDLAEGLGRAYRLTLEERAGVATSPIVCMVPFGSQGLDALGIGTQTQILRVLGDPVIDGARPELVTTDAGLMGKDAAWARDGRLYGISEQGLVVVSPAGPPAWPLEGQLESIVAKQTARFNYRARIVFDAERKGFNVFFEPTNVNVNTTHLWYDPRTNGAFPETYPQELGPTAVGRINGRVNLGTRDGRVLIYDDARKSDRPDLAAAIRPIHSYAPLGVCQAYTEAGEVDGGRQVRVKGAVLTLGRTSSGVDFFLIAADTAERAYWDPDQRISTRAYAGRNRFRDRCSGGAVIPYIFSPPEDGDAGWSLESLQLDLEDAGMIRYQEAAAAAPSGSGSGSGSGATSGFGTQGSGSGSGSGGSGSGAFSGVLSGGGSGGDPSGSGTGSVGEDFAPPSGLGYFDAVGSGAFSEGGTGDFT